MTMKTMLEAAFYAALALPWAALAATLVADEVGFRRRFRK
jgi:hypothetical protein